MAVIQNIINTVFNTSGDRDAENAANRVGRAQTRLAQTSAAAGREFASQSQGLGGLVGAYAGAAATTFALSAAFDALARSARAVQTLEGLDAIAAGAAQSGTGLLQSVTDITKGQLTINEAAQQINLSLSAGFDTAQIEGLAEVALRASRALGRDLTDSMTRVTRGSAKMETELLDELGIYTKIDPATRAYAAAIDKSVSSLSEYERRQAFVNSVIEEGQRKYQDINVVIPTAAEKIEALGVTLSNLTIQFGGFIADIVAPLADAISNNVTAAFATLGLVMGLVGGKAVELFRASITRVSENAIAAGLSAETFSRKLLRVQSSAVAATQSLSNLSTQTLKLNDVQKTQLKTIQEASEKRVLSRKELLKSEALINKAISNTEREINSKKALRDSLKDSINQSGANLQAKRAEFEQNKQTLRQLQQQRASTQQIADAQKALRSSQGALGAATRAFNIIQAENVAALNASRSAVLNLNADLVLLRNSLGSTAAASRGAAAVIAGAFATIGAAGARAISSIGAIAGFFTSLISKAFFWISILQLLGTTIANVLGKGDEYNAFFSELGKSIKGLVSNNDIREYRRTLTGLVSASLTDIENVNKRLAEVEKFTFRKKAVFGVTVEIDKTKEDIVREVSSIIEEVSTPIEKSISDSVTSGTAAGLAGVGLIVGSFASPLGAVIGAGIGGAIGAGIDFAFSEDEATRLLETYGAEVTERFKKDLEPLPEEAQQVAILALSKIQDTYKDAVLIDPGARLAKEASELTALDTLEVAPYIDAITQIRRATAASFSDIKNNFDFSNVEKSIQGVAFSVTEAFSGIGDNLTFTFLSEELIQELESTDLAAAIDTEGLKNKLTEDLGEESAKKLVSAINSSLQNDTTAIGRLLEQGFSGPEGSFISADVLKNFVGVQKSFAPLVSAQQILQQTTLQVNDVLGSTNREFARGSIDLERYSQNVGTVETAIRRSIGEIIAVERELENLRSQAVISQETQARISFFETLLSQANALLDTSREELSVLKQQTSVLENQQKVRDFLDSIGGKTKSILDIELALDTAQLGDELAAQELALKRIIIATDTYASEFNSVKETLNGFGNDIVAKILSEPVDNIDNLVISLNKIEGVSATAKDGVLRLTEEVKGMSNSTQIAYINLQEFNRSTLEGNRLNEEAKEKLRNIGYEALSRSIQQASKDLESLNTIIRDSNAEIAKLAQEETIAAIEFDIELENINNQIEKAVNEGFIKTLELEVDLVNAKIDSGVITKQEGATQENALQQQILAERKSILQAELDAIERNKLDQIRLLEARAQLERDAVGAEFDAINRQINAAEDNANNLISIYKSNILAQQDVNQSLVNGITDSGNKLSQAIADTLQSGANALNSAIIAGLAKQPQSFGVTAGVVGETNLADIESDRFVEIASSVTSTAQDARDAAAEAAAATIDEINSRYDREKQLIESNATAAEVRLQNELNNQELLKQIEDENAKKRLADAADSGGKSSAEKAADKMKEKLNAIFDGIASSINTAIMDFGNLLLYGPGENETFSDKFRSIFSNLFKSIQQTLFQETIAKPASNFITEKLLGISKTGIENAKFDERGNLKVTVANWLAASVPGLSSKPKDKDEAGPIARLMDSLTGEDGLFGGIKKLFSSIFGEGGFFSNLFSSISALFSGAGGGGGGFFGTLFQGILSIFGMASGGTVHRAGGGSIPSVNTRDRVSALLEPGEFVIRKPMARQIGTPALQQLNATGQMSGGNVQVNITNEGTPQQAQASAPRFDGEKYVIDIVTRDLANNGPIRRSLRGDR